MNTALAGEADTDPAPEPRKAGRRPIEPAPPRHLAMICERCDKRIRGNGAGFACLDLREASAATHGHLHTVDGTAVKAAWRVLHVKCAPEVIKPLNPYFRVWCERIGTVDELLDAVAELSRLPWFGATDWGGLVRRILADTDAAADDNEARNARRVAQRRRERGELTLDDPRHGTENAYVNYGCRCSRCCDANTAARNARKRVLSGPQSDQHDDAQAMSRARAVDSTGKRTQTGTDT